MKDVFPLLLYFLPRVDTQHSAQWDHLRKAPLAQLVPAFQCSRNTLSQECHTLFNHHKKQRTNQPRYLLRVYESRYRKRWYYSILTKSFSKVILQLHVFFFFKCEVWWCCVSSSSQTAAPTSLVPVSHHLPNAAIICLTVSSSIRLTTQRRIVLLSANMHAASHQMFYSVKKSELLFLWKA